MNSHGLLHTLLRRTRIPVPPLALGCDFVMFLFVVGVPCALSDAWPAVHRSGARLFFPNPFGFDIPIVEIVVAI